MYIYIYTQQSFLDALYGFHWSFESFDLIIPSKFEAQDYELEAPQGAILMEAILMEIAIRQGSFPTSHAEQKSEALVAFMMFM